MNIFQNLFKRMDAQTVGGLTDELKALYISNYFDRNQQSILFSCNSLFEANKFYQMLKNYQEDVFLFPMDDFMTSEVLAISPDFKITRLETLHALKQHKKVIVITNLMGYLRFLPTPAIFYGHYIHLKKDMDISHEDILGRLIQVGYKRETVVNKSGEIAVRGYVIDIFPIHEENPIRIEFWGDTIDSIRYFDVDTQLTIENISSIEIMPNTEFVTDTILEAEYPHRDLIKFGEVVSILDYLIDGVLFYNDKHDLLVSYQNLKEEINEYRVDLQIPEKTQFMLDFEMLERKQFVDLCNFDNNLSGDADIYYSYLLNDKFMNLDEIPRILEKYRKQYEYVIICVSNRYQANKIIDTFEKENYIFTDQDNIEPKKINIIVKQIQEGYIINNIVVISENEIFNRKPISNLYKTNFKYGTRIKDITKLNIGDYIVHNIHGIGRYCGIKTITKNKLVKDYLQIEYRDGDKLYIPVEKIDMISKYSSNEGYTPKVNKLGSNEWEKVKLRARNKAKDIADELLKLYALREMKPGFAFLPDDENQIAFEKEFNFIETADQLKAIDEIKRDMEAPHPMDRLLCGDVGYGKTEVAFRAAFKAILSGKQVALLCPTTILSNQHYQNALNRFKSFPIEIRLLNRFISPKQVKQTIKDIKEGKVDFVIGTHKLLNDAIEFKNLGLLIIDEEQRFGVTHKEKIKKYKENIDVLTLSATPIPRTLQMSMSGIRGLSLIETPPHNRYPVQTYVLSYNQKVLKDAIYKEISRQGQVFILYNHIDSIEKKAQEIMKLVPDARVVFAHGRMNKQELEDIMFQFTNHEFDILLCTTIIETGIDIPNVNTLLVMDADQFGLSQLYQLRGRVGRTDKLAYCYLMYDQNKILSDIAKKRLEAIKEFTELGSGLSIAMRDLSIRGAGDILGSEQAGFIDSVGIELFTKMLKEEIDKLNGKVTEQIEESPQPLIEVDTYVEDTYVKEEDLKIEIHKKINEIDSYEKLLEIKGQLEDRFGNLSDKLVIYMNEEWFEHLASKLKIKRVRQTDSEVQIILDRELTEKINGEILFVNALKVSSKFRFKMQGKQLLITLPIKNLDKHFIYYLIDLLQVIEKAI